MIANENPLSHKCELRQGQARVLKSSHEILLLSYRLQVQNRGVRYPEKQTICTEALQELSHSFSTLLQWRVIVTVACNVKPKVLPLIFLEFQFLEFHEHDETNQAQAEDPWTCRTQWRRCQHIQKRVRSCQRLITKGNCMRMLPRFHTELDNADGNLSRTCAQELKAFFPESSSFL